MTYEALEEISKRKKENKISRRDFLRRIPFSLAYLFSMVNTERCLCAPVGQLSLSENLFVKLSLYWLDEMLRTECWIRIFRNADLQWTKWIDPQDDTMLCQNSCDIKGYLALLACAASSILKSDGEESMDENRAHARDRSKLGEPERLQLEAFGDRTHT